MDTPIKNLTKGEKENVLLVLNEFSEEYKANTKSVNGLITSIKEFTGKIDRLIEKIEHQQPGTGLAEASQLKEAIETGMERIITAVHGIAFLEKELRQLSGKLDRNTFLLQNPIPQKVVQHHHVPKLIWIAAGLFLALALACVGWYMTFDKLNKYKGSDTKYRYLKLKSPDFLLGWLHQIDSLQESAFPMKDSVARWERQEQEAFELNKKLQQKSQEGDVLKKELEMLKRQNEERKGDQE